MTEHTIVAVAGIGVLGAACQWFAWRLRLPAILFLLLCGIAAGPILGWLQPEALFGPLLYVDNLMQKNGGWPETREPASQGEPPEALPADQHE